MSRTTISAAEMETLGGGGWLELFRFQTPAAPFASEIAARKNRNFFAAKCLLLSTEHDPQPYTSETLASLCQTLLDIGPYNVRVLLLASDRPITYFEEFDFSANYQLELPGGVVEADETQRQAALREAIEEGGAATGGRHAISHICFSRCQPVPVGRRGARRGLLN